MMRPASHAANVGVYEALRDGIATSAEEDRALKLAPQGLVHGVRVFVRGELGVGVRNLRNQPHLALAEG